MNTYTEVFYYSMEPPFWHIYVIMAAKIIFKLDLSLTVRVSAHCFGVTSHCLCDTFPKFGDLFSHRAIIMLPDGTCVLHCTKHHFEFWLFGGVFTLRKPWSGGVTNFGWKPPLHNSRNFIIQRSTSHATQNFMTPGEHRPPPPPPPPPPIDSMRLYKHRLISVDKVFS